ncbi:uncharacterized protein LOC135804615 [Sycon ciliatum]|uniref:uncharacterized protein LOC135804615 n=1 Tax=Sycon ciliatum TaxID=27933 RepID=UPI0031F62837
MESADDLRRLEDLENAQRHMHSMVLAIEAQLSSLEVLLAGERAIPCTVNEGHTEHTVHWPSSSTGKSADSSTTIRHEPATSMVTDTGADALRRPSLTHTPERHPAHTTTSLSERLKSYPKPVHPYYPGLRASYCPTAMFHSSKGYRHGRPPAQSIHRAATVHLPTYDQSQTTAMATGTSTAADPQALPVAQTSLARVKHAGLNASLPDLYTGKSSEHMPSNDNVGGDQSSSLVRSQSNVDVLVPETATDGGRSLSKTAAAPDRRVQYHHRSSSYVHASQDEDVIRMMQEDKAHQVDASSLVLQSLQEDQPLTVQPAKHHTGSPSCYTGAVAGPVERDSAYLPDDDVTASLPPTGGVAGAGRDAGVGLAPRSSTMPANAGKRHLRGQGATGGVARASIKHTSTVGYGLRQHTVYHCVAYDRAGVLLEADRRYNDFVMLRDVVQWQYPDLKSQLPQLPEKKMLGKLNSAVVEQRRLGLQDFLHFIVSHPTLQRDEALVLKPWLLKPP